MKNAETYIPAIVEQLSCEPDLSSLDEPTEVWSSGARFINVPIALRGSFRARFLTEAAAWEFRARFAGFIVDVERDPYIASVRPVSKPVVLLNGKGEVLRTWVVE